MELLTPIRPTKLPSHHSSSPKKKNPQSKNPQSKNSGRSTLQNITNANNAGVQQNGNNVRAQQKFAYVEKKSQSEKQGQSKKAIKPQSKDQQAKDAVVPLGLNEILSEKEETEKVAVVITTPSSPTSASAEDSTSSSSSASPSSPALVPSSPIKSNSEKKTFLQYDRDFLLSFKDKPCCKQTPPGKLPTEIIEEYNQECNQKEKQFLHSNTFVPFPKEKKEWKPKSQVQANKEKKDEEKQQIKKQAQVPQLPLRNLDKQNYSVNDEEDEDDFGPSQELNQRRLETRQRQIDIGKNTPGYQNYIRSVPKDQRKRGDPQTPHKHQICSKRSWDGQIRKWRRMLHTYDPEQTPSSPPAKNSSSPPAPSQS